MTHSCTSNGRKTTSLISENDYKAIQNALESLSEYTIVRILGDYKITVEVTTAPSVWGIPMLVQVREQNGSNYAVKNCASVAELRDYLSKWHFPMPRPHCPSTR